MDISKAFSKIKDIADAITMVNNGLKDKGKNLQMTCSFSGGYAPSFYLMHRPPPANGAYISSHSPYGIGLSIEDLRELKNILNELDV